MKAGNVSTLFVTGCVPFELSKDSHGVFQRMRMMLLSAAAASDQIRALFLASGSLAQDASKVTRTKGWLEEQFGADIDIQIRTVDFRTHFTKTLPLGLGEYFGNPPLRTLTQPSLKVISEEVSAISPNLVVVHRLEMFRAVRMACPEMESKIVLDLDDIEHLAYARYVRTPPHYTTKPILLAHVPGLLMEEIKALKHCKQVYICSNTDKEKLQKWRPKAQVITIPNGTIRPTDTEGLANKRSSREVLFVGVLDYPPNSIGMEWFLKNVWPLVVSKAPDARLNIVGRSGNNLKIPEPLKPSVVVHGFVESLTAMYRSATVAICPLLSGGGTRIKIIEAASYKTPIISTTVGAEGLAFEDKKSIVLTDNSENFAQEIVRFLTNPTLSCNFGEAAHSVFESHYEREMITQKITQLMEGVATIANCG